MSTDITVNKPKRWVIFLALAIPLIAVVLLMFAAGSGQVAAPPTQAKVHAVQVQPIKLLTSHLQERVAYGRVEASTQSQLGFELSGKLVDLYVDEGDVVSKGTLLAKLDTTRLMSTMGELDATLARTQADLRLANLSLKRVNELVAKKLESKQKLDEITESTASAIALVNEIKAKKQSLQIELDKSYLYANADLIILTQPIDKGAVVSAGQTVFIVQQENSLEVRVGLPQEHAFSLKMHSLHDLFVGERTLQATVKSIGKRRQPNTRTVDVIFSIVDLSETPTLMLLPGDLVGFAYQQRVNEVGTWVPKQALTSGIRGLWTLFVVSEPGQQQVRSKSVEILYSRDDAIYIRGGLNEQDWFVVSGGHRLVPSQTVNAQAVSLVNR